MSRHPSDAHGDTTGHAAHSGGPARDSVAPAPGNNIFQPKAKNRPQGQLAAFLRGRFDHLEGDFQTAELNRSNSAPPAQLPNSLMDRALNADVELPSDDPRLDPSYAAFYYEHSRLDPRLPPPLYAPGQSWQVWSGPGLTAALAGSGASTPVSKETREAFSRYKAQRDDYVGSGRDDPDSGAATPRGAQWGQNDLRPFVPSDAYSPSRRRNLVDMIQDDFPRTPSPVFAQQQKNRAAAAKLAAAAAANGDLDGSSAAMSLLATSAAAPAVASPTPAEHLANQRRFTRTPTAALALDDEHTAAGDHEHLRSVMNATLDELNAEQRMTPQPYRPHQMLSPHHPQRYGTPSTAASMARAFSLRQRLSPPPRSNSTPPSNQLFGRMTPGSAAAAGVPPGYSVDDETELMLAMRGMNLDHGMGAGNSGEYDGGYRARLLQHQLRSQTGSGATSPFAPSALYNSMSAVTDDVGFAGKAAEWGRDDLTGAADLGFGRNVLGSTTGGPVRRPHPPSVNGTGNEFRRASPFTPIGQLAGASAGALQRGPPTDPVMSEYMRRQLAAVSPAPPTSGGSNVDRRMRGPPGSGGPAARDPAILRAELGWSASPVGSAAATASPSFRRQQPQDGYFDPTALGLRSPLLEEF
ncbi:hypothetical protein THASP1DRAFT_33218, partial [Thamnocephalis sphaerospora]